MKIYDSLSNKNVEVVEPITIYCCGPTVYNDVHIGNIRPIVTFDVLNRALEHLHYSSKFVHNITDIDDKIINAAKKANVNELEFSNKYYLEYVKILDALNVKKMEMPKISENMNELITYVQKLIDLGHAYVSGGDVYFDVNSIKNYGVLSRQNINELMSGVRKEVSKNKKSEIDFALWKQTSEGINWYSPWSKGRPGWHTECAVLINKYFGKQVEIHGGGIDLKFPHHENENAQNIALTNMNIARIWMHVGHIRVNNEKMAKSLGNFILVKDLLNLYEPNIIRWFLYQTQYQNPINFSDNYFSQLKTEFEKLIKSINQTFIDMTFKGIQFNLNKEVINKEFVAAIENDLDFPNAIKVIWAQVKSLRGLLNSKQYDELNNTLSSLMNEFDILGIVYKDVLTSENVKLINEWKNHVSNKEFDKADAIRKAFQEKGII